MANPDAADDENAEVLHISPGPRPGEMLVHKIAAPEDLMDDDDDDDDTTPEKKQKRRCSEPPRVTDEARRIAWAKHGLTPPAHPKRLFDVYGNALN